MKQILINPKKKKILLDDIPAPLCKDEGVLIQVYYSLISTGTELSSFRKSKDPYLKKIITEKDFRKKSIDYIKSQGIIKSIKFIKDPDNYFPTGYSGAGVIIDVGKKITDLKIGERVAYAGAGHAEIVHAPRNFVVKLPDNVEFNDAAFTTLGGIALQAVRRAKVELGETILVIGLGLVGQLVNQLLHVAGCYVIGCDLSEKKIEIAREFGLKKSIIANKDNIIKKVMNYTDQTGVDAVIICAQSKDSTIINQAMNVCHEHGKVVVVGDVGLNLDRKPFYLNELDLKISRAYGPGSYDKNYIKMGIDYPIGYSRWTANRNMREFVKLISKNKVNVKRLIEKEVDIFNVQSAYEELLLNKEKLMTILLKYKQFNVEKPISRIIQTSKRKIEKNDNNINVAVIGAGGISKGYHLPNLMKIREANIYAIVSGTGINAKKVAREFNAQYCSTDYKEALEDKNIDCVLIATHHNLHKEIVIASAKSGLFFSSIVARKQAI